MNLQCVTITGADDRTAITELVTLSSLYPFVEWGILFSVHHAIPARFPSTEWLDALKLHTETFSEMQLSAHLCGRYVRQICKGDLDVVESLIRWMPMFQRIQLNFHRYIHLIEDLPAFVQVLERLRPSPFRQVIFQMDDVNNNLLAQARKLGVNAVPLFDRSGGAGILPDSWPIPVSGIVNGYAGGLAADNVVSQLDRLATIVGDNPIWIDCESRVRIPDNTALDIDLVRKFLEATKPYFYT